MDDFHHRRQTVGGAGGGGDDAMQGRIVGGIVDAHHHVEHALFFHRRGDHHALYALIQIGLQYGLGFHLAGGFNHHIAARPVGVGNGFVMADRNALAVQQNRAIGGLRFAVPAAVYRVEVQQMRQGVGIPGRIVDADYADVWVAGGDAHYQPSDAAEAVDSNL